MRDSRIDFLRFLGLAMIILAHVGPPEVIFQLRNFDVPLMVIVAGLSFRASFKDRSYFSYLWGRIKRLVFPVWLFLSLYFFVNYLASSFVPMPDLNTVLTSYLLLGGIGYVWIIRVFLLVAIASPFIHSYSLRQSSNVAYLISIVIAYLLYELLLAYCLPFPDSALFLIFKNIFLYLIPYAIVFSIGVRLPDLKKNELTALILISFSIFMSWVAWYWITMDKFVSTQQYKYPPQCYYLSYALFFSFVMYGVSGKIIEQFNKINLLLPIIYFIGQNSIWIYLWHIPLLRMIKLPFYLRYPLVFFAATSIAFLQVKIVKKYILPRVHQIDMKKNISAILTG
jgi:fucose 4-O-acetylase-like acetyltransferase